MGHSVSGKSQHWSNPTHIYTFQASWKHLVLKAECKAWCLVKEGGPLCLAWGSCSWQTVIQQLHYILLCGREVWRRHPFAEAQTATTSSSNKFPCLEPLGLLSVTWQYQHNSLFTYECKIVSPPPLWIAE